MKSLSQALADRQAEIKKAEQKRAAEAERERLRQEKLKQNARILFMEFIKRVENVDLGDAQFNVTSFEQNKRWDIRFHSSQGTVCIHEHLVITEGQMAWSHHGPGWRACIGTEYSVVDSLLDALLRIDYQA